jgi:drug/metabolite transporter (DMT)-like permease
MASFISTREAMGELLGVLAAVLSSAFGGSAVVATRYLKDALDPLALGAFRFGIGFALLLPLACADGRMRRAWPSPRDWPAVFGLGLLFFALFPILFNASLIFTSAARGALALSTLPLLTMAVGAILGVEPLTGRKTLGVLIAMAGVALALLSSLGSAPMGAWRGDLLMVGAAFCMALYNVLARPYIRASHPVAFTLLAMGAGASCLAAWSLADGGFRAVAGFGEAQWIAILYLGIFGGAAAFFLWAFALGRATPTRVAMTVTVNPIAASLLGAALLGEALTWSLFAGVIAVALGIAVTAGGNIAAKPLFTGNPSHVRTPQA